MAHCDTVVDGDGVELLRHAAGRSDLLCHELAQVFQVHVPRHELGERVDDGDDRFAEVAVLHSGRAPEGAGSGHVTAGGAGT